MNENNLEREVIETSRTDNDKENNNPIIIIIDDVDSIEEQEKKCPH